MSTSQTSQNNECNSKRKRNFHQKRKLIKKIKLLKKENETLVNEIAELKNKNEIKDTEITELKKTIIRNNAIRQAFSDRITFIVEFMSSLRLIFNDGIYDSFLHGSFTRQIFEYLMNDTKEGYGDCRGNNLDFFLYTKTKNSTEFDMGQIKDDIADFLQDLKIYLLVSNCVQGSQKNENDGNGNKSIDKIKTPRFGVFELYAVYDTTVKEKSPTNEKHLNHLLNIPSLKLLFKRFSKLPEHFEEEDLEVNLFGWFPEDKNWGFEDFDVNDICLDSDGLHIFVNDCCDEHKNNYNFLKVLKNIKEKKAVCTFDLQKIHTKAIELQSGKCFNKLIYFVINNWRKMIEVGYYISSHHPIPSIQIELEERCMITYTDAPYLTVKLICNCGNKKNPNQRRQSIQAYARLIKQGIYKCPICRAEDGMQIYFETIKPIDSIGWTPDIKLPCEKLEIKKKQINLTGRPCFLSDSVMSDLQDD
jgi:hypothetical protein